MSFLKNIKGLFIEEVPDPADKKKEIKKEPENKAEESPKNEKATTVNYTSNQTQQVKGTTGGTIDNKIFDSLMEALDANNQEGFDFLEFKNAVKALQSMPMDDMTK